MKFKSLLVATLSSVSLLGLPGQAHAAEYAFLLKTLANPFWAQMKEGIEQEAKKQGVEVEVFASPSEGDVQAQLTLFEDLLNKNYKGIAFAPISPVNLIQPVAKAYKKGIFLVDLDEKIDTNNLKQAGGNIEAFVTTDNVAVGKRAQILSLASSGIKVVRLPLSKGKLESPQVRHARRARRMLSRRRRTLSSLPASRPIGTAFAPWTLPPTFFKHLPTCRRSIAPTIRWLLG